MHSSSPRTTGGAAPFSRTHPIWLCDVWGVVHDGIAGFPAALDALARHRAAGGTVVLITNAPRPSVSVRRQLLGLGVGEDHYDAVVSSGDVARERIARRPGMRLFHLGPERDRPLLDGLPVVPAALAEAETVLCSGLVHDERETPDDYADTLAEMARRRLPMVCANPDLVVQKGDRLLWCAGALAERYAALGGEVIMTGKPHAAIYQSAFAVMEELLARPVDGSQILAIGDGIATDLAGAANAGLAALFVIGGIHGAEIEVAGDRLARLLAAKVPALRLVGTLDMLQW